MYSYGSSARVGGGSGKRGHGNRPYRAPPDRSKQETQPPPLKQCDCLVELDLPEYLTPLAGEPRHHGTFGGRQGMQRVVRHVRSQLQCHLQIPGKNQGNPVALVASSLEQALSACFYVMQHVQVDLDDNDENEATIHSITARIHRNVKAHVPVLTGRLYHVKGGEESPMGCLFRQDNTDAAAWSAAYYTMKQPATQLPLLQTCVDNLTFRDATCQYQIIVAVDATVFAMGLTANVDKLLAELQQHAAALAAAADTPKDET